MKFVRKLKWVIIALLLIPFTGWIYISYNDRDFLRYGVLHIDRFPNSLRIMSDESAGWTDQQCEYYVSINRSELKKLFAGRKYAKLTDVKEVLPSVPDTFSASTCYTSGALKNGLVTIFVNADSSLAYIVYDID